MKLKFLQDVRIAQSEAWLPILSFKNGQIENIENEYLIERLFHYKYVVKIDEKKEKKNSSNKKEKGKKSKLVDKNKAHITPKNKSFMGNAKTAKDLDVEINV
jgi:hypothetical protein